MSSIRLCSHGLLMTRQKFSRNSPFMRRRFAHYPSHLRRKTNDGGEHKFRRYNRPVRQWLSLVRDTGADSAPFDLMDAARSPDTISIVTPLRTASCAPIIIQYPTRTSDLTYLRFIEFVSIDRGCQRSNDNQTWRDLT